MPVQTEPDVTFLRRAIELAARGGTAVRPNPQVGAVIVRDGEVLGEGFHHRAGAAHAEVEAIRAAGGRDLNGSTMYVSLEPCSHHGRTPPCTDAIRQAGISRVVVAVEDPSDHASGRGLGILRDDGIEVVVDDGELAQLARLQNQPFRKRARTGLPWVLFKSAMSLDGKVATRSGDSRWISGSQSRALVHQWRATSDAIVVGIGTALSDDPLLTARAGGSESEQLAEHQPRRVVFDSLARLPPTAKLLDSVAQAPLTVIVSRAAPRTATDALEARGAEVIWATGENEPARVRSALSQLGCAGVSALLLEGGPHLAGAFLEADQIDEIRLFMAPIVLGGRGSRDPLESEGVENIESATRALQFSHTQIGEDILLIARMKEW
ncbi:MAG: bifunctional diaminohydroxyphosphoribosylaminopyrimidine deaminase/5-amino-6-(5-phosphoribosylamino)uracil reductase RibD [Solirubrobacteraceae bacterium]